MKSRGHHLLQMYFLLAGVLSVASCATVRGDGPAPAVDTTNVAAPVSVAPPVAPPAPTTRPRADEVTHVAAPVVSPAIRAVVDAADRTPQDRALDGGRHPAELLAFWGVGPGMRVAEVGAGGGYTTELLVRGVGHTGKVFAHNSPFVLKRFAAQPWADRLGRPVMSGVARADREFDDPFLPEAKNLDLVVSVLIYHDTVWMGADRDRMNRAVFAALRPGGTYAVVDHSARPGAALADVQTFHRIDEATVIVEVERAGFRLVSVGDFLRNPSDARDWNDSPRAAGDRRGTSDRFALNFVRP